MRIVFSAVKKNDLLDKLYHLGSRSFLFSYEDKKVINQINYLNTFKNDKFLILIDSGAFSAWNRGLEIDIDEYIDFMKQVELLNTHHELYFINLDVIPHKKGTTPTPQQIESACLQGIENYKYIKSKGFDTIHTFHQFDDFKYLHHILEQCNGNNYIGISPANDQSLKSRINWLKQVYSIVRNKTRTHMLGLTAIDCLEQIPVYSADSSSWINIKRFGELFNFDELQKIPKRDMDANNIIYYDFEQTCEDTFKYYIRLEQYVTKLWTKKGVIWN